jgi:hypothetical protein
VIRKDSFGEVDLDAPSFLRTGSRKHKSQSHVVMRVDVSLIQGS